MVRSQSPIRKCLRVEEEGGEKRAISCQLLLFHVAIITWKLLLPFRELSKTRREKSNNNKIVTSTVSRDSSRIFRYKSGRRKGERHDDDDDDTSSIETITQLGWIIIKERRGKL